MNDKDNLVKISFLGDIMCEKPLQKAAQKGEDFNFSQVFKNTKSILEQSDYVVGNLETVFAGKEKQYTNHIYCFNTPDSFADALAESGIDLVTTATNHCLDRGIEGLNRTIAVLDERKIEHIGTYATIEESKNIFVKDFDGVKIAFLSYTYGTNVHETKVVLDEEELFHVNLLKPQTFNLQTYVNANKVSKVRRVISSALLNVLSTETKIRIKRALKMPYNFVRVDHLDMGEINEEYLEDIRKKILLAKDQADYVVVCIHSGGQFNVQPGGFTKYIVDFLQSNGCDIVIGTHPHVVQKYEKIDNCRVASSLGNYNISPSSVYLLMEDLPEYSVMLNHYFDKQSKILKMSTFTILKAVEDKKQYVSVYPVKKLWDEANETQKKVLLEDVRRIYKQFTGKAMEQLVIEEEFSL